MQRRKFLSLSALAGLAVAAPVSLQAVDFRQTKADAWTTHTVDDAIKKMYGNVQFIEKGISLSAPDLATNGGKVPIGIKSDIEAKSLAFFQDANPESTVIAYTIHKNSVIDYTLIMKMKGPGKLTAVLEGTDGKFYRVDKTIDVTDTGCDGS